MSLCDECTWRNDPKSCAMHDAIDSCPGFSNAPCSICHLNPCVCYADDQWCDEPCDQDYNYF